MNKYEQEQDHRAREAYREELRRDARDEASARAICEDVDPDEILDDDEDDLDEDDIDPDFPEPDEDDARADDFRCWTCEAPLPPGRRGLCAACREEGGEA